ncbi:hypothetical protein [Enterococcus phage vB_Efm8_KEN21]
MGAPLNNAYHPIPINLQLGRISTDCAYPTSCLL